MAMRVILFTGRGGSGLSTISAATAVALAKSGQRTLAFGLGSGLGDALATPLTHEVSEIATSLFALEAGRGPDEPDEFRDWLEDLLDWRGIEPELADDLAALPGANQIGRMLNLAAHIEHGAYDAVVVDGLPLEGFLDIPPSLDAAARWLDRLFAPRQSNVFEPFVRMFAADYASAGEDMLELGRGLLGRLGELRDLFVDPAVTSVRLILRPDRTAATDSREALTAFSLFSYAVDALVFSRALPDDVKDSFFAAMRSEQARARHELRGAAGSMPLLEAAQTKSAPVGVEPLLRLAGALYAGRPPGEVLHSGVPPHSFRQGEKEYVVSLALPFADKEDLAVEQLDDGVAVHLNGRRCVLMLPPEVRYREAASWSFDPPTLKLTFSR